MSWAEPYIQKVFDCLDLWLVGHTWLHSPLRSTRLCHAQIYSTVTCLDPFGSISCETLDLACNLTALCNIPEWDIASLGMMWRDWKSVSVVTIKAGEFYISPALTVRKLWFTVLMLFLLSTWVTCFVRTILVAITQNILYFTLFSNNAKNKVHN